MLDKTVNHTLLAESRTLTEAKKHFMTKQEQEVKESICRLLVKNNHRKYAQKFWELDLNLVSAKDEPNFVAAISFDDATVYLSDGFITGGPSVFKQLDTIMRHELAHNLMMHQIRMMHVFRHKHANDDPDLAYDQIKSSMSLHELLNWIEDFEISNKRYSDEDKRISRQLELNGEIIHGLVTEDHRDSWIDMSLEDMYTELEAELLDVYSKLKSDPNWKPIKSDGSVDGLAYQSAKMVYGYLKPDEPSNLDAYGLSLENIEKGSGVFPQYPEAMQQVAKAFYNAFKDYTGSDQDQVEKIDNILTLIASTKPEEPITINHPDTNVKVGTLYTADYKAFIAAILKKIVEKPIKLPQAFVDAWTKVMEIVGPMDLSNKELDEIIAGLGGGMNLSDLFNF